MIHDYEAWKKYPKHHKWFNKLFVAEMMNYNCGPCGVAPNITDYYIVRPIYNLGGMGVGTSIQYIEAGDCSKVPPGYFWCEVLLGKQYSATYQFVNEEVYWKPISCWEGIKAPGSASRFSKWVRSNYTPEVPILFNDLSDISIINIEFKGNKPFEVHLRNTPDPDYNELIPIWEDDSQDLIQRLSNQGYKYIESYDNSCGFLFPARLGFMVM